MTDQTERNRERARRYVEEVLSQENVDAVEELAAPPSEWHEDVTTLDGTPIESYEDAKRWLRRNFSKFEDWSVEVDTLVADGDEAMVSYYASGRIVEEWFGVPSTGRPFETLGISYLQFEDEGWVKVHDQWNMVDFMPEVAKVARRGVVREMRDGIVVVDEAEQIVDVNPAVAETFAVERDALLGEPAAALLGEDTTAPQPGESVVVTGPADRRYFEVEASPLSDQEGERIGRTLVLREITERRRNLQQLEVLNRVLRHNLRNDLAVVQGNLEAALDRAGEAVAPFLAQAADTVTGLLATAETARAVQNALVDTAVVTQDPVQVVDSLLDRGREQYPAASIEADFASVPPVEASDALADGLWELLTNACEHAGETPHVEVAVSEQDGVVEVAICDDGPGIPAHERAVLEAGEETDLQHGSGLGLWLAHWVLEESGGTLAFTVDDGTTVRARLPRAPTE